MTNYTKPLPIVSMLPTQPIYQRALNNPVMLNNPVQAQSNPANLLGTISLLTVPIAMGVSWSRNHSIWKTALAGIFSQVYLAYVVYDRYANDKK